MRYAIEVVGENELPKGINAVIVEPEDGPPVMLLNGAVGRAWQLMRSYEGTLEPCGVPSVSIPLRLVSSLGVPVDGVSGWQALSRNFG